MFKLILFELKKIFLKRSLVIFLILLSLFNIGIFAYSQYVSPQYEPDAYHKLQEQLDDIANDKRYDFVQKQYKQYQSFYQLERLASLRIHQSENQYQIDDLLEQYPRLEKEYGLAYKENHTPYYTDNLESEVQFLKSIIDEFEVLHTYSDYIEEIQKKAQTITSISIFQKDTNREQNNVLKTAKDYQDLASTPIIYESQKGIESVVSFPMTSFLIILAMMVLAATMILEEKEKNLFAIIKMTPKGQFPTMIAKCIVMMILILLLTSIMVVGQVICAAMLYGLGDISRSIQSLANFSHCSYRLTISQFLFYYVLVKWLAASVIGLFLMLASVLLENKMVVILTTLSILVIEYALYMFISPLSAGYLFKYINIISILQTDSFFQLYRNVYIFGHLLSLQFIIVMMLCISIFILLVVNVYVYHHKENMTLRTLDICFIRRFRPPLLSLKFQELYKILVIQKGFILLVLCLLVQYYQYQNTHMYIDSSTRIYQQYMQKLEGPLTKDKEQWILVEQAHYQDLEKQLVDIASRRQNGEITQLQAMEMQNQIEQQLIGKEIFQTIFEQYQDIKEHPKRQFVLPFAYQQYFIDTSSLFMPILLLYVCVILIFANTMSFEYQNQMHKITQPTLKGNRNIIAIKYGLSILIGFILLVVTMLPTFIILQHTYGFSSLFASVTSIHELSSLPETMPIFVACVCSILLKMFSILVMITTIHAIGVKIRNHLLTLFIGLCVFFLPLLLTYGGIHLLDMFSLYPLLFPGQYSTNILQILFSFIGYGMIGTYALKTMFMQYQQ